MFERDLFIRDVFLWFLLSGMWLFVLEHSMGTSLFIAFFLAVLFYPFFSVWRYTVKIIPEEDLPPEIIYFGHPLKITDQTPDRAEKPEDPEQIEKQEKIKELKRTEKPAEQTEKPIPPPETPGQTEPVLPKDLRTIAIQLEMTTPFVKNESFCRNIASIARTLNRISDFADAVKQDAKTQDCVQEAAFYSREFYTMLLNYNKIACGVLHTEESGQLAAGVEAFAEDLKTALIKIFETAVNPKLLESKSRLNALRQEMRMKGLVE